MDIDANEDTPEFVRVREAWFKAGADALAGIVFLASLPLAAVAGLVAAMFDLNGTNAVSLLLVGVWLCIVGATGYISITARRTARRGGVPIDKY